MSKRLFTSESVTEGHPDKIADAISDAILDSLLSQDSKSRVAVETLITTGQVHVAGEVTTNGYADVMNIVRETVLNIGYDSSDKGFDGNSCGVSLSIGQQSSDIAQGVDSAFEKRVTSSADPLDLQGAGDQGLMFGYACDETPELMPFPIQMAHSLVHYLAKVRKGGDAALIERLLFMMATRDGFGNVLADVVNQHANGGYPHLTLPGKAQSSRQTLAAGGEQCGLGAQALQSGQDGVGVAIDVCPHLQNRRTAIAPGQRGQQGSRGQAWNVHRAPRQFLEAQRCADFFRESRKLVVVKDDVGHGLSPEIRLKVNT